MHALLTFCLSRDILGVQTASNCNVHFSLSQSVIFCMLASSKIRVMYNRLFVENYFPFNMNSLGNDMSSKATFSFIHTHHLKRQSVYRVISNNLTLLMIFAMRCRQIETRYAKNTNIIK